MSTQVDDPVVRVGLSRCLYIYYTYMYTRYTNNAHCIIRSFCKYHLHIRIIVTIYLISLLVKNQLQWKLKEPWTTVLPLLPLPRYTQFFKSQFFIIFQLLDSNDQRKGQHSGPTFLFKLSSLGLFRFHRDDDHRIPMEEHWPV